MSRSFKTITKICSREYNDFSIILSLLTVFDFSFFQSGATEDVAFGITESEQTNGKEKDRKRRHVAAFHVFFSETQAR